MAFFVGLKASVGKASEMQRSPEAIGAVGEVVPGCGSRRRGIDPTKHDLQMFGEDV